MSQENFHYSERGFLLVKMAQKSPPEGWLLGRLCWLVARGSQARPNSISNAPQSIWPNRMCISWMRAVVSDGTTSR